MSGKIKLATAQFNVSSNIEANFKKIKEQILKAAKQAANVIHFSECCLTGYPGFDIKKCLELPEIERSLRQIKELAKEFNIWVIIGSHYFQSGKNTPYNSIFVYGSDGRFEARYDKRVLAGAPQEEDQAHYIAGDQPLVFSINGINCGIIICHEWRYPELFREYKELGVELIFHSFYDGNLTKETYKEEGIELGELILGSERGNAANNYLWISAVNTSKMEQTFPSSIIRPDGSIAKQATRNKEEVFITDLDFSDKYIDPSEYGRLRIKELYQDKSNR